MNTSFPKSAEMNFDAANVSAEWRRWKQNMTLYIDAVMTGKTQKEKYSAFLYCIGQRGRDIYNTFTFEKVKDEHGVDTDVDDITVAILFTKFQDYCNPKTNVLLERRKFFRRDQKTGECFDTFLTELRNIASNCNFGALEDELILYRIVEGVKSNLCRDRLLRAAQDLDLKKALNICRTDELTKTSMKEFSGSSTGEKVEVNAVKKQTGGRFNRNKNGNKNRGGNQNNEKTFDCKKCGRRHGPRSCPAFGSTCPKCEKPNHWASKCTWNPETRNVNEVKSGDGSSRYFIEAIGRSNSQSEATVVIDIGEGQVRMKLDTGAEVSVLPARVYKQLQSQDKSLKDMLMIKPTNTKLVAYGGADIPVLGTCNILCSHNETNTPITFYVVEVEGRTVLSLQACQSLNLIKLMCSVEKTESIDAVNVDVKVKETVDEKVNKIKDLEGKDLKKKLLEMYLEMCSQV